jgi:hypothetical protein
VVYAIDPFGNYLCQKLLEHSTDEQRNIICESVAQDLVTISLNMHGTRAVQKMIDFLSTRRQASHPSLAPPLRLFFLRCLFCAYGAAAPVFFFYCRLTADTMARSIRSSLPSACMSLCLSRTSTVTTSFKNA